MKTEKVLTLIGKKLQKEYNKYGFKYSKKYKYLKKTTKKFEYYVFFSSFFGNTPDTCIELHVILMINDRVLLEINRNSNIQLFCVDLWETGSHYNITNETLINETFIDLRNKIDDYLIPHIKTLEGGNV